MSKSSAILPLLAIAAGAVLLMGGASNAQAATEGPADGSAPKPPAGAGKPPTATPASSAGKPPASSGKPPAQAPASSGGRPPASSGKPPASSAGKPPASSASGADPYLEAAELAAAQSSAPAVRPKPPSTSAGKPPASSGKLPAVDVDVVYASAPAAPAHGAPAGYDAGKAKAQAPGLARHIRATGYNYTRKALVDFQRAAGIAPDGVFGPLASSALAHFGGGVVKPLFKGAKGAPSSYVEP